MDDRNTLTAKNNGVVESAASASSSAPSSTAHASETFVPPRKELNKVRLTILVGMMFSLLVAGIFRTPPIVFMAALLGVAPPLAIFIGRWSSKRLLVSREVPASGQVGEIIYGRVRVHNKAAWPAFLTEVRAGQVAQPFYPLADEKMPSVGAEAAGLHEITLLRPGETVERLQAWRLNRRGVYQLPAAQAASTDPLALFNEALPSGQEQTITVLPRVVRLNRLGFIGGSAARLQAPQHASVVADALDFHGVRPYQPGEPIRRVHWKSTARTGQLQIVEWEENVARDLAILIDTSRATMAGRSSDNTLETAIVVAASIAQHLLEGGYGVQLFCWQTDHSQNENRAARTPYLAHYNAQNLLELNAVLSFLARILPVDNASASLPTLAREANAHIAPGRAALLISSTLAPLTEARSALRTQAGAPCYAIVCDANSFETEKPKTNDATFRQFDALTRMVRRGDALAAIIEQMA